MQTKHLLHRYMASGISQISSGYQHSLALKSDGTGICVGWKPVWTIRRWHQ